MGISMPYRVPARVKEHVDRLSTEELFDLMDLLKINTQDAPDTDHYDWCRQRIFDWLYASEAQA